MINFIILYFVNLVLDYPLQGSFLAEWKQKNNYILFVHCAIWAFGLSIVLLPLGLFAWWKVIMLLVGHFIIDYWKCRKIYKKWPRYEYMTDKYIKDPQDDEEYVTYIEPINMYVYSKPDISDIQSLYIDQFLHLVQVLICLF